MQLGNEANLGVECKRVGAGEAALNQRYVTNGVNRFVTGQYGAGHDRGVMLGHVPKLPSAALVEGIDARIRTTYGEGAKLVDPAPHADSLSMHEGGLLQGTSRHVIRLTHVFVDVTPAAASG